MLWSFQHRWPVSFSIFFIGFSPSCARKAVTTFLFFCHIWRIFLEFHVLLAFLEHQTIFRRVTITLASRPWNSTPRGSLFWCELVMFWTKNDTKGLTLEQKLLAQCLSLPLAREWAPYFIWIVSIPLLALRSQSALCTLGICSFTGAKQTYT